MLEGSLLSSSASIDVVSEQLGSWVGGVDITLSVGVESWLSEVSGKGRVGEPSCGGVNF